MAGSLSKTYAMTGWRIGSALAPAPIISAMTKLQSHSTSNPTSIAQKAAVSGDERLGAIDSGDAGRIPAAPGFVSTGFGRYPEFQLSCRRVAFDAYPNIGVAFKSGR